MQRNISRREFGKRLAGGGALLALQPAADDLAHVVHKKPIVMLRPGDAQDIAKLVQFANRQGLKVAMRGQGHSAPARSGTLSSWPRTPRNSPCR